MVSAGRELVTDPERPLEGLVICCFGHYARDYARNRIVRKALRGAGASVFEVWDDTQSWFRRNLTLFRLVRREHFDVMVVGFPGYTDMPLARAVCWRRGAPLVFDAFVSQFDTHTADRRKVAPGSIRGRFLYHLDRVACRLADVVLLDTEAHRQYFADAVGVPLQRSVLVPIGADDADLAAPEVPEADDAFVVTFYGTYMPLHGVDVIVRAAEMVAEADPRVRFLMIGRGQTLPAAQDYAAEHDLANITFLGPVPYGELRDHLARSHVCLGIFGTTGKAGRVIPNKVYDGLALGRAVITADTPGSRELLVDREHALLVPPGDARALADAVLALARDDDLRRRIAGNGHRLFVDRLGLAAQSRRLATVVLAALEARRERASARGAGRSGG